MDVAPFLLGGCVLVTPVMIWASSDRWRALRWTAAGAAIASTLLIAMSGWLRSNIDLVFFPLWLFLMPVAWIAGSAAGAFAYLLAEERTSSRGKGGQRL